jgi:ATP-binding protein involved in chromosome partitioning
VLGIVENMSGEIFGRGGAKEQAEKSKVPFLGEVPITAHIRELGDAGRMSEIFGEDCPVRDELQEVCQTVAVEIARQLVDAPALPTLEVL